ncbi:helix-turn-helix domain-containing protein [Halomicrococcus sp. SG-WS-1]|uniref:helix-turn-helix domain-containing protein n=1 Tax=Halomicrococcus sp. SG-WS-1 TaxID=3439057 RepID=UPI003F7A672D
MATEATFTVAADEFPLGTIFESVPGVTVKLERIVPGDGVVIPYFWARGVNIDDVEAAFSDHAGVNTIRLIDNVEDEYLLRVEWDPDYVGILSTLADAQVPLISAVGTNTEWMFELRGDNRRDLSDFQQLCRERDIPVTLTALHALTPIETTTESALTDPQHELLVLAYERGYFNSPRDVTMEELGDELGISQQAVASRLRRGICRVLGQTLSALES